MWKRELSPPHEQDIYDLGYREAVGNHAGLVAAAEAVIDAFSDSHRPFEARMLTLESALNNLLAILEDKPFLTPGGK